MKLYLRFIALLAAMTAVAASCQREPEFGVVAKSSFAVSFAEGSIVDELGLPVNGSVAVSGAETPLKLKNGKASGKVMQSEEYYAVYPASALEYFTPDGQSKAVLNLPTVQTAVKGSIPEGTEFSVAAASAADWEKKKVLRVRMSWHIQKAGPDLPWNSS